MSIKEINAELPALLRLEDGEAACLEVFSFPGTGYLPNVEVLGNGVLAVHLETPSDPSNDQEITRIGQACRHLLHVKAVGPGEARVVVHFSRPWIGKNESDEEIVIVVKVPD